MDDRELFEHIGLRYPRELGTPQRPRGSLMPENSVKEMRAADLVAGDDLLMTGRLHRALNVEEDAGRVRVETDTGSYSFAPGQQLTVWPREEHDLSDEEWSRARAFLARTGTFSDLSTPKEEQMDFSTPTPGNSGPIPPHEAQRVARMIRRLPRDQAREVLAERRRQVGEARFRQEAAAITRAAGELDRGRPGPVVGAGDRIDGLLGIPARVPTALPNDPTYEAVLFKSSAESWDSRFRRQLGRQP